MFKVIPRAAIYIRVSTKHQTDKFGLEYQERLARKIIHDSGWYLTKIYEDKGISGTLGPEQRSGLNMMLNDAKNNLFDIIAIYSLDRLARENELTYNLLDTLKDFKVRVVSYNEDLTDKNQVDNAINYSISELKTIKSRLAMGREQKKIESGYIGGRLPYGYSMVDKNIEINSDHAHVVRSIYHGYHTKKFSLRKIADILNKENIPSPRDKEWDKSTVTIILDNKDKYDGGIINNNENGIRWPKILNEKYPYRIKKH
jgi:site-specific DNA recombinase